MTPYMVIAVAEMAIVLVAIVVIAVWTIREAVR